MLITFHSDSYENISYFADVAKSLITLMGHSGTVPGAIKAEDLSEALDRLQSGLSKEKDLLEDDEEDPIALAKRAIPLIALLRASIKNNDDVLWD